MTNTRVLLLTDCVPRAVVTADESARVVSTPPRVLLGIGRYLALSRANVLQLVTFPLFSARVESYLVLAMAPP